MDWHEFSAFYLVYHDVLTTFLLCLAIQAGRDDSDTKRKMCGLLGLSFVLLIGLLLTWPPRFG